MPSLHDDIIAYLKQQRQMYGDVLFVDPITHKPLPQEAFTEPTDVAAAVQPKPKILVDEAPPAPDWRSAADIDALNASICACTNCALGYTRTKFVFGSGNAKARLMVVGEAPGADEDAQGLPFVGRAGQLLTKILESVEIPREDVYICNILKCRPPNNRKPLASETDECEPYLKKQIELVRPSYILALGLTAANTLLNNKLSMSAMRGQVHNYQGIGMIVTFHPAALLRNPAWKRDTWEDVKFLKRLLETT